MSSSGEMSKRLITRRSATELIFAIFFLSSTILCAFTVHERLLEEQVNLLKSPLCNGTFAGLNSVSGLHRGVGSNSLHGSNGLGFGLGGLGPAEGLESKLRPTARLTEIGVKTPTLAGALAGGVGEQLSSRNVVKSEKQLDMTPNSNTSHNCSNQKKQPQGMEQ